VTDGYELAPAVRQAVRFHQHNLLTPSLVGEADRYDVIFCRNLLIYFDRPTQDRAIMVLGRLLMPAGMLFVGPSETGVLLAHHFHSARLSMAFAFRPGAAPSERRSAAAPVIHVQSRPAVRPVATPAARPARVPSADVPASPTRKPAGHTTSAMLETAQRLADEGRFDDAVKTCEAYLRQHSASPPGHYLLALVHDAAGNVRAAEMWYRKTLYLDPEHDGALAHLALLMDTQGRTADAALLRKRVQRLTQKKAT
jgi:chemotaxis protein methyltransferase WspC